MDTIIIQAPVYQNFVVHPEWEFRGKINHFYVRELFQVCEKAMIEHAKRYDYRGAPSITMTAQLTVEGDKVKLISCTPYGKYSIKFIERIVCEAGGVNYEAFTTVLKNRGRRRTHDKIKYLCVCIDRIFNPEKTWSMIGRRYVKSSLQAQTYKRKAKELLAEKDEFMLTLVKEVSKMLKIDIEKQLKLM